MKIPEFATKKELYNFLVTNKGKIIAAKKSEMKQADAVNFNTYPLTTKGEVIKSDPIPEDATEIKVRAIINTTNLMDSHDDVHIPGLWKKSLQENKDIFHDQEHKHDFSSTISDYEDLTAYTKSIKWKELGQNYEGETEALTFDSNVRKERNEFMFDQYKKRRVKNHSVGMQYVKMFMAINDKDYKEEFATWNKYFPIVANKDKAENMGYFFAVTEAKLIEGSAVKRGSNWVTPTQYLNEPSLDDTQKEINKPEPTQITPEQFKKVINEFKFF